jgi:hypothetical protein
MEFIRGMLMICTKMQLGHHADQRELW